MAKVARVQGDSGTDADEELIREVRHAAGNLVQRMHYWTIVLEDETAGKGAAEPLASLRSSLDCLHRLIVRSLDLVRVTETRLLTMSLADVVAAIALRFGGGAVAGLDRDESRHSGVVVDPLVLERALGLLAEVLVADDVTNGRSRLAVRVEGAEDASTPRQAIVSLHATHRASSNADPFAKVHARVSLALAIKLLGDLSLDTTVDERDDDVAVHITLPLCAFAAQRDARSAHRPSSRDSRDVLPL